MSQNYYQILEVPADADATTIKKSFRKLAMLYHPDKHADNTLKAQHYLHIQEAYQTLIDTERRKDYDIALWLEQKDKFSIGLVLQPSLMIKRLQRFAEAAIIQKKFHVLEDHLSSFLLDAMNDTYMAVLQTKGHQQDWETFADYILFISKDLPKSFREPIFLRLQLCLAEYVPDLNTKIEQIQAQQKVSDWYRKNLIWLLFTIGFLLCVMMYLYAKNKH